MSNIEDDVKIVKEFIDYAQGIIEDMEYERPVDVTVYQKELTSMTNILAERELKNKRIQELEEELAEFNKQLDLDYVDENFIPRQVVKDVLQNNRNELFGVTYLSKEQYKPYEMQIERINKIEQELLEGER